MTREHEDLGRYLDGDIGREQLPGDLRAEEARFERLMATLDEGPVSLPPWVRQRIMQRVRAASHSPVRSAWDWVARPRTVRLSPLTGAVAVAAAVGLILLARPGAPRGAEGGAVAVASAADKAATRFVFIAPGASSVAVTGDFVDWDPDGIPLESPRRDGVWVAEVELTPGVHNYVFVIDGREWRPDPNATQVDDGFGQRNSVLIVPAKS